MSKISLIIQREYLTRVKKKSFIVMSILGPLLFAAMMVLPAWLSSMDDTSTLKFAVIDQTNKYQGQISNTEYLQFDWLNNSSDEIAQDYKSSGYDAYIIIEADLLNQPDAIKVYSDIQITIDVKQHISRDLKSFLEKEKLSSYQIDGLANIINDVHDVKVKVKTIKLGDDGSEQESSTELTMIASIVFSFLIYLFVLLYGTQVMRGVIEEKTSRIVEVIISSVKPFQLMMGKIVGIAMVALTQFTIWVVLTLSIYGIISAVFLKDVQMPNQMTEQVQAAGISDEGSVEASEFAETLQNIIEKTKALDLAGNLIVFIFYFLGGYLLYATLFAAIGSAIDNETDSQQFVMPVMIPLILAFYVSFGVFRNPGSDIAFWFSMIPLTSPVVMMTRMPFEPPLWEVLVSMTILTLTFIFTTWFAGRIYRTGILMYGKKVTYAELWKWFKHAGK